MSTFSGKVHVLGVSEIEDEPVFVLEFLQARNPRLVRQPFFARFDPKAAWFNELVPATERDRAFFLKPKPTLNSIPLTIESNLIG